MGALEKVLWFFCAGTAAAGKVGRAQPPLPQGAHRTGFQEQLGAWHAAHLDLQPSHLVLGSPGSMHCAGVR